MPALLSPRFATPLSHAERPPVAALLLRQYLAGRIADAQWERIEAGMDAVDHDASFREAYAAYCLDAVASGLEIRDPQADEAGELLQSIR